VIIVVHQDALREQIESLSSQLEKLGAIVRTVFGPDRTMLNVRGISGPEMLEIADHLRSYEIVEDILYNPKPYTLVSKDSKPSCTIINVGGVEVGSEFMIMAGPCTVESESQLMKTAEVVAKSGAKFLRGGAYKPSTSPYSFHGLGQLGLELLREAGKRYHLKVITEVMDVRKVDLVGQYCDVLQIGTRNMQNYDLLREVGRSKMPVVLKRGMCARYEEWLLAAEYIASKGNDQIILCERGIRSFETYTRNTLDLAAVPVMRALSHLPIIIDPSQGTGRRELVASMSKAALACGADGVLIEVHPEPEYALKDGQQSITLEQFEVLAKELTVLSNIFRKEEFLHAR
jgi:3-deoxy-7-phosphoheptulonate synthase